MKKIILLLFLFLIYLRADFIDSDFDGVKDSLDKCPNTPFNALVDKNGCPTKYLNISVSKNNYDFYSEVSYLDYGDKHELSTLFYLSMYKKEYYFSISTTLMDIENQKDFSDVTLKVKKYIYLTPNFYTSIGIGVKIPTKNKDTNKIDVPLYASLNYSLNQVTFYGGGSYTFVNDKSSYFDYKNSKSYYIGASYDISSFSINYTYIWQKSRYDDISKSLGFGLFFFPKNSSLYYSLNYINGLNSNAIDNIVSVGIGKNF